MDSPLRPLARLYLLLFVTCVLAPGYDGSATSKLHDEWRRKRQACEGTATEVSGKASCQGKLVFEDNFDGPLLDARKWTPDIQIAGPPDYEFAFFTNSSANLFFRDGLLFLKPTLVSAANGAITSGTLDLRDKGCTGATAEECLLRASHFNILPPVASARIRSRGKFSFKFGVVEVRAKLPDGFWLYPEMLLEPAAEAYGAASGRVLLAHSCGNLRLLTEDGEDVGARRLAAGLRLAPEGEGASAMLRREDLPLGQAWNDAFHVFKFVWRPTGAEVWADGRRLGALAPPRLGFAQLPWVDGATAAAWAKGGPMAPFDRDFFLTLGLGVGGIHAFPDGTSSAGIPKPWRNTNVKMKLQFLREKPSWRDTWAWDDAALQVDYVRVWAL